MRKMARAGFTLVELIITLSILGILLLATMPMMISSLTNSRLSGAADEIVAALEFSQASAIASGRSCRVVFDSANQLMTVQQQDYGDFSERDYSQVESPVFVVMNNRMRSGGKYVVDFKAESRFSGVEWNTEDLADGETVTFDSFGAPDLATTGIVTLSNQGHETVIEVNAQTGRVIRSDFIP